MHIIGFQLKRNIGNIWPLNGWDLFLYLLACRWDWLVHVLHISGLLMRILWIIQKRTAQLFATASGFFYIDHYLDDFFGGHPRAGIATQQVIVVFLWFAILGIPTQWKKLKWHNWKQTILG